MIMVVQELAKVQVAHIDDVEGCVSVNKYYTTAQTFWLFSTFDTTKNLKKSTLWSY